MVSRGEVVSKARSQLNYTNAGNRYGSGNWCAHFVCYVYDTADGVYNNDAGGFFTKSGRTDYIEREFRNNGKFISASSRNGKSYYVAPNGRTPQAGDLIFFDRYTVVQDSNGNDVYIRGANQSSDHIGIVTAVSGNSISFIDGNNNSPGNKVQEWTYSLNDAAILGYGLVSYNDTPIIRPDSYESNNSFYSAKATSGTNSSLQANIHNTTDQDWFKFTLNGTGTSENKIWLTNNSGGQYIELYNSSNSRVRSFSKSVSLAGLSQGTYYAKVYDKAGLASGNYTLNWNTKINLNPDRYESNNSFYSAKATSGTNGSLQANIHNTTDQDWFKFTLNGTGTSENKIWLTNNSGGQYIELYNSSNSRVRSFSKSVSLAGLSQGTYYAKVYDKAGLASGNYTLNWNTKINLNPDRYESNNSFYSATATSGTKGSLQANIHNTTDQDWFKFTLTGTGTSSNRIWLTNNASGQYIELYNASNAKVRSFSKSISLSGLGKGTYYAKVYDKVRLASGNYTLNWNTATSGNSGSGTSNSLKADNYESNNTRTSAKVLSGTNSKLQANIHNTTDQDWFKFTLNGTGTSSNRIWLTDNASGQYIELYNASNAKVRSFSKSISLSGLGKGTYYAKVYDKVGLASGNYTLNWNTATSGNSGSGTSNSLKADNYESNNTRTSAKALSGTNSKLQANIHTTTDQDWFKFTLDGTGTSSNKIWLTNNASGQYIELYNSSNAKVRSFSKSISLSGLGKGTYYAKIYDKVGLASGNYTLNWNTAISGNSGSGTSNSLKADNYESNNTRTSAKALSGTNSKLQANIHTTTDQDWFKFTLDGTGTSSNKIWLTNNASGQYIELYNASNAKVRSFSKSISLSGLGKGTYYAKVYDKVGLASGNYTLNWNTATSGNSGSDTSNSLKADNYESNNTRQTATSLSGTKNSLQASIHTTSDVDWFKFTLNGTGTSDNKIELVNASSQCFILYNSNGIQLTSDRLKSASLEGRSAGTYYVKVYDVVDRASGNYMLRWNTSVSPADQREYEPNNSRYSADSLSGSNGTLKGSINSSTDEDWFKLTLNGKGDSSSKIEIAHGTTQRVVLYDANGTKISSSAYRSVSLADRPAGTYYVKVYDVVGFASGDYTLTWNTASNTRSASAATARAATPSLTSAQNVMYDSTAGAFAGYLNSAGTTTQAVSQSTSDSLRKYGTLVQA